MNIQPVQLSILTSLLKSERLRYSQARPEEVENDLYNYHLQYLVHKGLVQKDSMYYSLTKLGKRFVAELNPISPTGRSVDTFKLAVLTLVVDTSQKELSVLYQTRTRHPFFGYMGVMGGTIRKGEPVLSAASRKLEAETGLKSNAFTFIGSIRKMTYLPDSVLFTDVLFHVCYTTKYSGDLISETMYGQNYWVPIGKAISIAEESSFFSSELVGVLRELREHSGYTLPLFYMEETRVVESV